MKQDIKDFYLAGSHQFILSEVSASFENKAERQFVVCALEALLNYQFVSQSFDKGSEHHTVYRVQQGCGIGKNYSGALADWLFFRKVERDLLDQREKFGIKLYLRFRDDLLTVLTDLSFSPVYREKIIGLASAYCVVGIDDYSLVGVPFLDFFVFKSNPAGLGRLRHRVFIKKTARHVPLASSSYHPRAVHRSWPVAEVQRMARRCDDLCTGRLFQKQKLDRFAWFLLDPEILELCKAWRAKQGSRSAQLALNSGRAQPSRKTCKLILPFRRVLVSKALLVQGRQSFEFVTLVVGWSGGRRSFFFL